MARARLYRLIVVALCALAHCGAWPPNAHAAPVTPLPPMTDADYFTFADHIAAQMDRYWNESKGFYRTGARSIDTICSAAMLTI